MRTPSSRAVIALVLTLSVSALAACSQPPADAPGDEVDNDSISEVSDPEPTEAPDEPSQPGTGNLSQEARDQGFSEVQLPGGWPSELPLPDGTPVSAMRSGKSFYLVYDLSSAEAGLKLFDWYQSAGWSVMDDVELGGVHSMTFGSPETDDYGPERVVGITLGMTDWPTGLQYSLTVQDD